MADRILAILGRLRRRMLVARAGEGAVVAGTVGGLVAADLMAAWIPVGQYPLWSAGIALLPLAGGLIALWRLAARAALHPEAWMQWLLALSVLLAGVAALLAIVTGAHVHVGKNAIFLLVPAFAAGGASACLLRGLPLWRVACVVDRKAGLQERLSTAWELRQSPEQSGLAPAVERQALTWASRPNVRTLRFWTRWPAAVGRLGLAVALAALMLPWDVLESPQTLLNRQWRQVSAPAGEALEEQLAALADAVGSQPEIARQVARLAELARRLRSAQPDQARQWRGAVLELESLTDALRQALASGKLDVQTARQVTQLVRTLEQVGSQVAEGMGTGGTQLAVGARQKPPLAAPPPPAPGRGPRGWTSVVHPQYAALASKPAEGAPPDGHGSDGAAGSPVVQVPFDQAWRLAAEAAARRDVPTQYRQLVRDYFSADRP